MGRENRGALTARGMSVQACSLGTGIVLRQAGQEVDTEEICIHLSVTEARELAGALVIAVQRQHAIQTETSISSLFVQGLAIEDIAVRLEITVEDVMRELHLRGFLKSG